MQFYGQITSSYKQMMVETLGDPYDYVYKA